MDLVSLCLHLVPWFILWSYWDSVGRILWLCQCLLCIVTCTDQYLPHKLRYGVLLFFNECYSVLLSSLKVSAFVHSSNLITYFSLGLAVLRCVMTVVLVNSITFAAQIHHSILLVADLLLRALTFIFKWYLPFHVNSCLRTDWACT